MSLAQILQQSGAIESMAKELGIDDNTLVVFIGDQGLADTALLDLSVRPAGTVQTASASGPGLEPQVVACLETTARAMRFPAMRGETTLQVTRRSYRQGF